MLEYEIHSVEDFQLPMCLRTLHEAFEESEKRFGYTKETYPSSGAYITLDDLVAAKARGVHMYAALVDGKVAGYVQLEKVEQGIYAFRRFAVLPEYQNAGLNAVLINLLQDLLFEGKAERYETNLNLETNTQVMAQWKYFNARQHKRRRAYVKDI